VLEVNVYWATIAKDHPRLARNEGPTAAPIFHAANLDQSIRGADAGCILAVWASGAELIIVIDGLCQTVAEKPPEQIIASASAKGWRVFSSQCCDRQARL
jgi:hypothetical protein